MCKDCDQHRTKLPDPPEVARGLDKQTETAATPIELTNEADLEPKPQTKVEFGLSWD